MRVFVRSVVVRAVGLGLWLGSASAAAEVGAPALVTAVEGVWPDGVPTERGLEQAVAVRVIVGADGVPRDAEAEADAPQELAEAARKAALAYRFTPAMDGSVAVDARVRVLVVFPARSAPPAPPRVAVADSAPADSNGGAREPSVPSQGATTASEPAAGPYGARARTEAPVQSASETVRKADVLSAAPHRTGSDLLLTVPGMFVTQHSGEGKAHQLFYRGFDASHGQDVETWVASAPVNEVSNLHGQGYADLHFVIPETVRTLRALPGTYDVRQGDFAVAGTMRYELGLPRAGVFAKGAYGSFGTQRYVLGARPGSGSEQSFAAAELYATDGFGPSRAARRASALAQHALRLTNDTQLRVMVGAYAAQFDSAGVLRLSDIQTGAVSRFATYDPTQGGASQRGQLVLELRSQDTRSTFVLAPYLVLRSLRLRQNFTGYLLDAAGDGSQQLNSALTVGATSSYRTHHKLFSAADTVEIGLSARSDWIEQSQRRIAALSNTVTAEEIDANVRALAVGSYAELTVHPHPRLTARGGLRLDGLAFIARDDGGAAAGQARSSQGLHVGKKASVQAVAVRDWLDVVASYGEGFRSPQARSLAQSESTPFTRVRSAELGLRLSHGPVSAHAAGFYTWLSDDRVFDPATTRNERVPATARSGATLDVLLRPRPDVLLSVHGTYTHAVFRASSADYRRGDLVPYAPQLIGRADLAYRPALAEWKARTLRGQLGVGVSGLARRPLPYAQLGHGFALVDALAGLSWGELSLTVSAFNLFDTEWYDGEFAYASRWDRDTAASLVPVRHVTVGAPRTVLATLEVAL